MNIPTLRDELTAAVNAISKGVPVLNMDEVVKQVKKQGSGTAHLLNGLNVTVRRQWLAEYEPITDAVAFSQRKRMRQQLAGEIFGTSEEIRQAVTEIAG